MAAFQEKWNRLLSVKRYKKSSSQEADTRNEFHKDYDRIIFCSAFRRLGKKTQVHPLSKNDHIHTRLTHSMEVSSVGRSLGQKAGEYLQSQGDLPNSILPQDIAAIVQAACLAHDIGNPPFGHAGEYAIRHWFKENRNKLCLANLQELHDFLLFEGNAQGFRVVTQIENRRLQGGLNLTYATLGTLVKYPWFSNCELAKNKKKFNFYKAEQELVYEIFHELNLVDNSSQNISRHPLSYLMEGADDICYKILDIEDGLELALLRYSEVEEILVKLAGKEYDSSQIDKNWSDRRKIYYLRSRAVKNLISKALTIFIENYEKIMRSEFEGDLVSKVVGDEAEGMVCAQELTKENIFLCKRKIQLEIGAYETVSTILESLIDSVNEHKRDGEVSFKSQRIMDLIGRRYFDKSASHYDNYLLITDQLSGMTDDYASYIAGQLRGYIK